MSPLIRHETAIPILRYFTIKMRVGNEKRELRKQA
jgi:hypothetical protein